MNPRSDARYALCTLCGIEIRTVYLLYRRIYLFVHAVSDLEEVSIPARHLSGGAGAVFVMLVFRPWATFRTASLLDLWRCGSWVPCRLGVFLWFSRRPTPRRRWLDARSLWTTQKGARNKNIFVCCATRFVFLAIIWHMHRTSVLRAVSRRRRGLLVAIGVRPLFRRGGVMARKQDGRSRAHLPLHLRP